MNGGDAFPCKTYFIAVILYLVFAKQNHSESSLTKLYCYESLCIFKWVYGNPGAFLVGVQCIPAYHVDYCRLIVEHLVDKTGIPVCCLLF